jgi:hypothetical protein
MGWPTWGSFRATRADRDSSAVRESVTHVSGTKWNLCLGSLSNEIRTLRHRHQRPSNRVFIGGPVADPAGLSAVSSLGGFQTPAAVRVEMFATAGATR